MRIREGGGRERRKGEERGKDWENKCGWERSGKENILPRQTFTRGFQTACLVTTAFKTHTRTNHFHH